MFNFYPPDYTFQSNLVSPASALLDSASVFTRANVVCQLLYESLGPNPTVTGATGTQTSLGDLAGYGGDAGALVGSAGALFLHGTMLQRHSLGHRRRGERADPSDLGGRVRAVAYLVLTSPADQVER